MASSIKKDLTWEDMEVKHNTKAKEEEVLEKEKSIHLNKKTGEVDSYCTICRKSGHESKDCYFRCTWCKIPNHCQRDFWFKDDGESSGDKNTTNFSKEKDVEQLFYAGDKLKKKT